MDGHPRLQDKERSGLRPGQRRYGRCEDKYELLNIYRTIPKHINSTSYAKPWISLGTIPLRTGLASQIPVDAILCSATPKNKKSPLEMRIKTAAAQHSGPRRAASTMQVGWVLRLHEACARLCCDVERGGAREAVSPPFATRRRRTGNDEQDGEIGKGGGFSASRQWGEDRLSPECRRSQIRSKTGRAGSIPC
ncbi:hypothetical protein K438DRAFT_1761864 [Mycena galopus ATCC 62051]|nr:hypothetical protein K438DRAFT_1761864 [Mycena galopus ATCC 62051]